VFRWGIRLSLVAMNDCQARLSAPPQPAKAGDKKRTRAGSFVKN
jgi:hypothetical protein